MWSRCRRGKDPRISPSPPQVRKEVDTLQLFGQHRRREPLDPLVEVPEHHFRSYDPAIVHDRRKANRLMTTLAHRRAEMHVVEMHSVIADGQVDPLTAAGLAAVP